MANFCTKCGKKLELGVQHVCGKEETVEETVTETKVEETPVAEPTPAPVAAAPAAVAAAPAAQTSSANQYVNSYIDIVKNIFTKPVDTIKKYATADNFILGIIAIVINCVVTGLMSFLFVKEMFKTAGALGALGLMSILGGSTSLVGLGKVEISFMDVFLPGALYMAAWFATAALVIFVIANTILKDKIDIKRAFALVGVCSVFTTITTLAAIICIYINTTAMLVVLLVAAAFYMTHLYQGIIEITEIEKNKLAYVFVPAISAAMFVMFYVMPKIMS